MNQSSNSKVNGSERAEMLQEVKIGELLQNDTRINIFMYLKMNARLSFGEIVRLVGKSKSTVHHHLQKLIEGGLVQEVKSEEPRDQFDPKHYELVPAPKRVYTFSDIASRPLEEQVSAFLTATKIHQHSIFYLYQIADLLRNYLDKMEKAAKAGGVQADPVDLQKIWDGTSKAIDHDLYSIKFKDIFYYNTQVSEHVYQEYLKGLDELRVKISKISEREKEQGEIKEKPYFIYHISAPLGKQFLIKPAEHGEVKKKVR